MPTSQHTPGPWAVTPWKKTETWDGNRVSVETEGVKSASGVWVVTPRLHAGIYGKTCAEGEANARLIAAAPAMLEALQTIQQTADRFKIYEIARSAVAKAQGRDSRKEGGK